MTAVLALLLAATPVLAGCVAGQALTGQPAYSSTLSASQQQALQDWKIRAGLYASNDAPPALAYVPDNGLTSWTTQCQSTLDGLDQYLPGLLGADDGELTSAARAFDTATRQHLHACIDNDPVALHHAEAAMKVAATNVNTRYARMMGYEPMLYNTPKVL